MRVARKVFLCVLTPQQTEATRNVKAKTNHNCRKNQREREMKKLVLRTIDKNSNEGTYMERRDCRHIVVTFLLMSHFLSADLPSVKTAKQDLVPVPWHSLDDNVYVCVSSEKKFIENN